MKLALNFKLSEFILEKAEYFRTIPPLGFLLPYLSLHTNIQPAIILCYNRKKSSAIFFVLIIFITMRKKLWFFSLWIDWIPKIYIFRFFFAWQNNLLQKYLCVSIPIWAMYEFNAVALISSPKLFSFHTKKLLPIFRSQNQQ